MNRTGKFFLTAPVLTLVFCGWGRVAGAQDGHRHEDDDSGFEVEWDASVSIELNDDEEDLNDVVIQEYFGCEDDDCSFVPYYRRYYDLDDADLYFLFFVARQARRPVDEVIRVYQYNCDRDDNCLIAHYSVDPGVFFVDLPLSITMTGPLYRPYRSYWAHNLHRYRFNHDECRALVSFRIGIEFGSIRPQDLLRRFDDYPLAPHRVLFSFRESFGRGGRDMHGRAVNETTPRPWTMSERQRTEFHQRRRTKVTQEHRRFEQRHDRRVEEVRKREPVRPEAQPPKRRPQDIDPVAPPRSRTQPPNQENPPRRTAPPSRREETPPRRETPAPRREVTPPGNGQPSPKIRKPAKPDLKERTPEERRKRRGKVSI